MIIWKFAVKCELLIFVKKQAFTKIKTQRKEIRVGNVWFIRF